MSYLLRRFGFAKLLASSALASAMLLAGFALMGPSACAWAIMHYIFIFGFGLARATQFMGSNMLSYSNLPDGKLTRATKLPAVTLSASQGALHILFNLRFGLTGRLAVENLHI